MSHSLDGLGPITPIAQEFGLSLNTVRARIEDGSIRGGKIAGRWVVDESEARRVLGEQPDRRYTRRPRPTCTCGCSHTP
jgi:hypothetical protein